MEHEVDVYMDIGQATALAGRLWMRERQLRETATFKYAGSWLNRTGSFPLAPNLMLTEGAHQSPNGLFAAFTDPAPDKWGQKLMRHYERERAASEGRAVRKLFEADFLVRVTDETRLGALRFKYPETEEFLSQTGRPVPFLADLRKLLGAAERIEKGKERRGDLGLLLAPGGSLGGARPKAVVRDKEGRLLMAKFPWKQDEWSVILWEKVTLDLAKAAGVDVADYRLEQAGLRSVLLTRRFDRSSDNRRIHYISLLTALNAVDHDDSRSYLEIVDALRQFGSEPEKDVRQMWRRMVFNVLVSNTDDHVRNHGFLVTSKGWRLAPAFDMNPCPADIGGRIHKLALNEDENSGSLDLAMSVAPYFRLENAEASEIAAEVGESVSKWKEVAAAHKIEKHEIERLESAFDHQDLKNAVSLKTVALAPKRVRKPAKKRKASKSR